MEALYGLLLPFLGTSLGAASVFFMKKAMSDGLQKGLTGFAAGVMTAASVWSLLIPAIERSEELGKWSFAPAAAGLWLGFLFLLALDHIIPHLHWGSAQPEGPSSRLRRTTMMVLAVTLHNIPEGMAVGVVCAGYLAGDTEITAMGVLALSLGIAVQNFPEGAIVSMPLRAEGEGKLRAFAGGVLSGVVEPIGALVTIPGGGAAGARPAVSAGLCRRGHALCGGGGDDSGDVPGTPLPHRCAGLCCGLQRDDGAGRGPGMTVRTISVRCLSPAVR